MPKRSPEVLHPTHDAAEAGEDLRLAIWKDPTNRDALRVYADWLAEQGSTRGEYMQIRLLDSPTDAQASTADAMLKKDGGMWLGAARPFVRTWRYAHDVPGFLEWVEVEAYRLIEGFAHIEKLGPRMRCSITAMRTKRRETEARMAELPLAKLWYITLTANALDDKSLKTLAKGMQGVRALRLDYNDFGRPGLEALGASVTTLRALSLQPAVKFRGGAEDTLVRGYIEALVTVPGFRSLRMLQIRGGKITPDLRKELQAALPELQTLETGSDWAMTEEAVDRAILA